MSAQLTVAELIEILQGMPQHMLVEMGMNQEYQQPVTREELRIDQFEFHNEGQPFLHIGD
jgi:hypothetical protein